MLFLENFEAAHIIVLSRFEFSVFSLRNGEADVDFSKIRVQVP